MLDNRTRIKLNGRPLYYTGPNKLIDYNITT